MELLVVVPFLDEQETLPRLLGSIEDQTRNADHVVLVDDGSSDGSAEIAEGFAVRHEYATVIRRPKRARGRDRLAGAPELNAFELGVAGAGMDWDVLGKVDADVLLSPKTFETLLREFEGDPSLGIAGPRLAEVTSRGIVRTRSRAQHVEGATKFYRRQCYEAIAPLPAFLGWDTIDEIRAHLRGWHTQTFAIPSGDAIHLRPMGSVDGMLLAHRRWGECAWAYGEHPLHVLLLALRGIAHGQRVLGGIAYVFGWAHARLRRAPRAEPEVLAWTRNDQLSRIRARVVRGGDALIGRVRGL